MFAADVAQALAAKGFTVTANETVVTVERLHDPGRTELAKMMIRQAVTSIDPRAKERSSFCLPATREVLGQDVTVIRFDCGRDPLRAA